MARRRRRRSDSTENLDGIEGLEDEGDDLDFRVASLEEELKNVSLSTAMQARDNQAMRAKLEALARDVQEGPEDDEAFEELDELERKFEHFTEEANKSQTVLAERVGELIVRLDTLGGVGRLEDLPRLVEENVLTRLDEQLETLGQNLEQRLGSLETARSEQGDVSAAQIQEVTTRVETSVDTLRTELDQVLRETQQELSQALAETVTLEQLRQLEEHATGEMERLQGDFQSELEKLRHEMGDLEVPEELKARVEQSATSAEVTELRQSLEDLQASISDAAGLGEKAREAMQQVDELSRRAKDWESQLTDLLERSENSATLAGKHNDKVELAVKLVNALEEKVRTVSGLTEDAPPPPVVEEGDETQLGFELDDLLQVMIKHQASDLHLKVGQPPTVRLDGELIPVGNQALSKADCSRLVFSALDAARRRQLMAEKDLEFSYEIPGARFRVSSFLERGNLSASFHMLASEVPEVESLGLPAALKKLAMLTNGLVIVSGPPGSGKSTTLAAMVEHINANRKLHLIAIEDPIEFFHEDKMSLITQREVGPDTLGFAEGLRRAVRQDPDVILVGDIADAETASAALEAASTGHLVLAAMEALNAEKTILRFVELFADSQSKQARKLAHCLRGIVSLRLVSRADQKGLVPACEVLVSTKETAALVAEGNLSGISNTIYNGASDGMQTFTQSLSRLIEAGLITQEEALRHAEQPAESGAAPATAPTAQTPSGEGGRPAAPPPAGAATIRQAPPGEAPAMTEEDTLMNWL